MVEAFSVVAILAPLARSRQKAVLAFERSNDDPHSVSDPLHFLLCSGIQLTVRNGNPQRGLETDVQACDTRIHSTGYARPVSDVRHPSVILGLSICRARR